MALADLNGEDITRILNSTGPVVTCVLVRGGSGEDTVSEVSIDTTPSKREVENLLGGPITFLGQYPEEGIVVMTIKEQNAEQASTESAENRVRLPMPLDEVVVSSDVLLMKVSQEDEGDDDFFLDYSKENYLDLVSRGGEMRQEPIEEESDSEVNENEELKQSDGEDCSDEESADSEENVLDSDDDCDEDFSDDGEDMELDSDEERIGMLNICMGQILRRFHQENGHGPDTRQLLEMRHALALKLGVDVLLPPDDNPAQDLSEDANDNEALQTEDSKIDDLQTDENPVRKSIALDDDNTPRKRVKFSSYVDEQEIEMVSAEEQDMATDEHDMAPVDEQEISSCA